MHKGTNTEKGTSAQGMSRSDLVVRIWKRIRKFDIGAVSEVFCRLGVKLVCGQPHWTGPQGCHMHLLTFVVAAAIMAFHNSLTGRLEELRYPSLRSPEADSAFTNGVATSRPESSYFSTMSSSNDARGNLQRRFTTDSSKMSLAKPFGAQYGVVNSQSVRPHSRLRKIVRPFLRHFE